MKNGKMVTDGVEKLLELRKRYFQLKMAFWQGDSINTASFKLIKKEIARIKTAARGGRK